MASTFYLPDCLSREGRMVFYKKFRVPKLFRYAKNLEWSKICKRCQEHPRIAAKEAGFQHEYAPNETPLHVVLHPFFLLGHVVEETQERQDVENLVQERHLAAAALLRANKDACMKTCCLGTCPLTLVAMDPYGLIEDVDMLLSSNQKSALVQDLEGRTPLHYACINNRSNESMIRAILRACPEAVMLKEKQERLPLHYACMASVNPAEVTRSNAIAFGFEEMLAKQTKPICTRSVVSLLLDENDKAACVLDKEGKAPLHHLCRYIQTLESKRAEVLATTDLVAVLCLLVERNPKVAHQPDKDGFEPMNIIRELCDELGPQFPNAEKSNEEQNDQELQAALRRVVNVVGGRDPRIAQ